MMKKISLIAALDLENDIENPVRSKAYEEQTFTWGAVTHT